MKDTIDDLTKRVEAIQTELRMLLDARPLEHSELLLEDADLALSWVLKRLVTVQKSLSPSAS